MWWNKPPVGELNHRDAVENTPGRPRSGRGVTQIGIGREDRMVWIGLTSFASPSSGPGVIPQIERP